MLQLLRAPGFGTGMTVEIDMSAQTRSRHSSRPGPEAKALDAWTRLSLGERFDATLAEKLPDELVALVLRFGG